MTAGAPVFPTIAKLASECGESWPAFDASATATLEQERLLVKVLREETGTDRILDADSSLVLCGSFARYEMVAGSDCDWTLLVNGVVNNRHAALARRISRAIEAPASKNKGLKAPGSSGTFGNMSFSHDLVHRIGGGADSNENLTRRILMLLESRPVNLSPADSSRDIWNAVIRSILERYFEEDVHFSPSGSRRVPRFLLNDLTRYWRTIGVDYAAKHLEQDGHKWAIRNAKIRFSRKLLYAAGLAFCFACDLERPKALHQAHLNLFGEFPDFRDDKSAPFIAAAVAFAGTPPLEFLAAFVDAFVTDPDKRITVSRRLFGTYNEWLQFLGDEKARKHLESLGHKEAPADTSFQRLRTISKDFQKGLQLLFFNRDTDPDDIAALSLEYAAF